MATNTSGRWATALASDEATAREAKSELAGAYWYPAYAFFRASGVEGESAAVLTETVLTQLIEDPVDGAPLLREWMLDLAKAALANPTPRAPVLTVDREWSEQRFAGEGTHSPGETFVRRWTLDLLEQAVTALQAEYEAAGKSDAFAAAQSFLGYTGGAEGGEPYAALAAQLGVSDGAARTMVFELRKRYREVLHAAVADTVATEEQIAAELQSLLIQLPAPAETVAPRPVLGRLDPEQLLARGMNSVQMSTAGGLGWTPPTIAEAARLFPGYEVVAMLGHGGMGAVYQARQQSLDRLVALKLLPLEISVDPSFADRFRREARAMAKLNHPNIISVHDFGQTSEGHLFFAMEFVEGASLHDLVHKREGGLPPADALGIIEQVCEALSYAHEQGIVHRDIKPANVMIDGRGRAKIADFGLARITDSTAEQWGQTMTGVIMGTPDYMAPEQKRGMQVDSRADIYSVGVMFYEMLCGETPQGAFELPSQRCGLPKELDAVVTRAIAPQVEKRFQTTAELKQAVATAKPSVLRSVARKSQAAAARQPAAVPMVPIVKAAPVAKGNPLILWGSIAAGVVILGAGGALVFGSKKKPASKVGPKIAAAAPSQTPATTAAKPSPTAKPPVAASAGTASTLGAATKEAPFVNGLGMKFVPVPITGGPTDKQRVLFSVWETRVQDYAAFATETKREWKKVEFEQGPAHPAVNVTGDDAQAFCAWLTERERKEGKLGANEIYRLPSDHEWSCAVGIADREDAAKLPDEKDRKLADVFPWGSAWPPPENVGNLWSEELRPAVAAGKYPGPSGEIAGYHDGFAETAPVGSYAANPFGLYDLEGNVREWCQDRFAKDNSRVQVQRGGAFRSCDHYLLSASRGSYSSGIRFYFVGFRCVLAGSVATGKAPAPALVAAGDEKWVDGLAQWFGGTKTNEDFVRENNGGARIGGTARSLQPIPSSAPKFRDQVVRMRWHGTNPQADAALYVRLARNASGKDASYSAAVRLAKEGSWKVRLSGPAGVLENADWKPLADFKPEASHTMELRVIGDLITVSVDGRKVIEVRDSQLTAGNPAFSGHDVVIESFEYANLDPAAPAPAVASAKPASATPIAAAAPLTKPVDLLALVDVKRDASKGEWARAAGGVVSKKSDIFPILEIEQSAPAEYDFEIEFTIAEGAREVSQALAVPGGTVFWQMGFGAGDETFFCFGPYLDGKKPDARPEALLKRARLNSGQRYRSLVEVRKDSLRALIDGVEVLKWTDDFKRFGNPADYCKFKDTTHLGLAAYKSDVTFHKAELRPFIPAAGTTLATVPAPAKAEPAPVAIAAAAQPGKAVDLLALVDVKRDAIEGEWARKHQELTSVHTKGRQLLEIAVTPPDEYDFEIEFTMGEGLKVVAQALAVQGRSILWHMAWGDGSPTNFCFGPLLDGKRPPLRTEASVGRQRLKSGQRYRSLVEVRKDSLRALIDGEEILKWSGDLKRLTNEASADRLKDKRHLGLVGDGTEITFHKAELRPVGAPAPTIAAAAEQPANAPAKPASEMEKWLAQVDGPQQESYQREVMKPFEAGLAELQKGYLGALDSRIATASTAGQLDVALGWRNELQRFREGGQAVPADDADLATVAAPLVAKALPPLRTQFRTHKAKLDADRLARAKAAFAKYDAVLSPNITLLTQRQRLDDALLLKTKRDEVQKAWLPAAPAPAVPAPGVPSTPAPKPLGSGTVATPAPAPTSKAATAAAIRAAAEWVIAHGGQVEVPGKTITKPEDLPVGALAVQVVTFKLKDAVPTDAELHALTALGAATNVKVENWDAPDSTLIFLQAFGNVGLLQFVGCPQLTDAMLEGLPPMPNVTAIFFKDCPGITGTGLAKLKAPKLNEVFFTRGAPTDAGLAAISQHDGIKTVQAGGPAITDAGVAHLERLRALTKLILSNTSVTPSALTFLAKRKEFIHLDYLNAAAPDFVANAQAIAKIVPNLPNLGVNGKASGPEATRALLGFKSLRSLGWAGSEMNDATFGELAALTDLEDLSLRGAPLTDAAVDTLLALKKLTILDFCDSPELTDAGLLKLKPLKKLKRVHFSRTKATEAGAAELKKGIPGVEVFR